ncbi:MAG: aminotransferase class V-fold PLP-dependent enzyme, partial [Bdellovibrionota bacterium]
MKKPVIFLDNASTTRCLETAGEAWSKFSIVHFGNPSSSHSLGQLSARAIHEARLGFGSIFRVAPEQVVFTGSGTESDNLAIYGVALETMARRTQKGLHEVPRVICSAIEHAAVKSTVHSLSELGFDVQIAPVQSNGQLDLNAFLNLVTPATLLVSVHLVNNIVGSVLPVEDLARRVKERAPRAIFHTDAVQAFGKIPVPTSPSAIDLLSISGHKFEGPKGVGALIFLNRELLKSGAMRPMIRGGDQEGGWRSGTQSAGLISAFRGAAEQANLNRERNMVHVRQLR